VKGLATIVGVIFATAIVLAIFTAYGANGDATTIVWGLPVTSVRQADAHGWLALGQSGSGVLVIAQAGVGVVAFVQVGASVFFGIGQAMASLVGIAQVGLGVFGFVGQMGLGAQAIGQGVFRSRSAAYFKEVSDEVTELLSFRGRG